MKNGFGKFLFLFWTVCFTVTWSLQAQPANDTLSGIWEGKLHIGSESLKLVLVLSANGDSLSAVLDSPDQYVTDIPVSKISFVRDTLCFSVTSLDCRYVGKMMGDSVVGKFTQYSKRRKLTLHRTTERQLFLRPQEPQPPFPYDSKDLRFACHVENQEIRGTLTLPAVQKAKGVVVLISGSGLQDRDETICAHKPFKLIADHLTRAGYAVFRYDDAPMAVFQRLTTYDFADQVETIIDTLRHRPELQGIPIGLLGHSEGGMVAWIVASRNQKVQFVVSMAGMAIPLHEILLYQVTQDAVQKNLSAEQCNSNVKISDKVYTLVERAKKREKVALAVKDYLQDYAKTLTAEQRAELKLTDADIMQAALNLSSPWMYTLLRIRPEKYMAKVKCPVLALNGEKDKQVEYVQNLAAIRLAMKRNANCTTESFPALNHLFQECETGFYQEYGTIEQTIAPEVLQRIVRWLDETIP